MGSPVSVIGGSRTLRRLFVIVRHCSSLFVIVGVFYTFTLEAVVSVRLRSPALVSKQVSNPHIAPLVILQACC
jgi:hypothetical protein